LAGFVFFENADCAKNRFYRHKERNQYPHHVPTGSVQQGLNFAIKRKPIQAGLKIG
jgi:hypothetical protein